MPFGKLRSHGWLCIVRIRADGGHRCASCDVCGLCTQEREEKERVFGGAVTCSFKRIRCCVLVMRSLVAGKVGVEGGSESDGGDLGTGIAGL